MTKLDGIIVLTNYDRGLYERELNLFPIAIYNPPFVDTGGRRKSGIQTFPLGRKNVTSDKRF